VFLSEPYKNYLIDNYVPNKLKEKIKNKISIIPNGIDDYWLDNIEIQNKEYNLARVRLLQVGDLNKNKNVETTVKAIELLREKGINAELNVVGRIHDESILNKIKDLDHVNYMGFKTRSELLHIFRENDIFVLPSIKETFGLVYAEAMTQGLPVIYTRGQGFDGQFIDGEVGYSVDCYNPEEIAIGVNNLLKNYGQISQNCISNCVRYNWKTLANEYREIYNSQ
jgi:glycosyltransferase involved in cell wall biosynthesis